jgi:ABC-2 type transport system permease protein
MPISSQLLNRVTGWLPIRPFNEALTGPLSRHTGAGWRHLAVLAVWGMIGAAVAIRRVPVLSAPEANQDPTAPASVGL